MVSFLTSKQCCMVVGVALSLFVLLSHYQSYVNTINSTEEATAVPLFRNMKYSERVGNINFDGYFSADFSWYQKFGWARGNLTSKARQHASSLSHHPISESRAVSNHSRSSIPVIGITVFKDVNNYLQRLLDSIDIKVGKVVVTCYGVDVEVDKVLETFRVQHSHIKLIVNHYPVNMGCAFGFNEAIISTMDEPWWLIVNSDIAFPPGVLSNIAQTVNNAISQSNTTDTVLAVHTFTFQYGSVNKWSNFAITRQAVSQVGLFDENFYPAFWEDVDYGWRVNNVSSARQYSHIICFFTLSL